MIGLSFDKFRKSVVDEKMTLGGTYVEDDRYMPGFCWVYACLCDIATNIIRLV